MPQCALLLERGGHGGTKSCFHTTGRYAWVVLCGLDFGLRLVRVWSKRKRYKRKVDVTVSRMGTHNAVRQRVNPHTAA